MTILGGPKKGTLALVGAGEYTPAVDDIDRYLLQRVPGEPCVVCMPTAAGREGPDRIAYWSKLGTDHFSRLGARAEAVHVIDRDSAMDASLSERISASNFVYLSGGDARYLHRTLSGTRAWEAIVGVMAHGGVVAGCSAGAMIWGEQIPSLRPPPLPWMRGVNLIPGAAIVPHFDEMPGWVTWTFHMVNFNRPTMVGIDSDTALIASEGLFVVRGSGRVVVWGRRGKRSFMEGDVVD